jgi:membrane fusion protein (multidrug efflux system)
VSELTSHPRDEKKTETTAAAGKGKPNRKRRFALIFLVATLILVIIYGGLMIKHRIDFAVTDAVFVDTDQIINIGFKKVGGRIAKMLKVEGDQVRKGELLARLDPRDYELAISELKARIRALEHQRRQQELSLQKATRQVELKIGMARDKMAGTRQSRAALKDQIAALATGIKQLERDVVRYRNLFDQGVLPRQKFETIETRLSTRKKELAASRQKLGALDSKLAATRKEIRLARSERLGIKALNQALAATRASLKALNRKLEALSLDLEYCRLTSPITGRIAKKYHSLGDVVGSGMPVYALVNPADIHILVLLEEKKLEGVKPGCPAKITIDAFPDEEYRGEVEAILPTSAAKFALVPRDISAGEFTKVVQRIPVKVRITSGDIERLRPGMGGEIEIERQP